jgi:hypothetical protein
MSTTQWANIGDDAGALHALVERVRNHVAVEAIDFVWIFPARKIAIGESIVVVVAAFDEDPERRRVITARFTVSRNRKGVADVKENVNEHGAAPTDAVPRIVQGVLRRLGEDVEAEPRSEEIGGDSERWDALIVDLGGRPVVRENAEVEAEAEAEVEAGSAGAAAPDDAGESPLHDAAAPDMDLAAEGAAPDDAAVAPSPEHAVPAEEAAAALDTEHPEPQL